MVTNHVYPAWVLFVAKWDEETDSADWLYSTWQGEQVDPDADVQLAGDGFHFRWGFESEVVPPLARQPSELTIKLSCASTAVAPEIAQGDILACTLARFQGDLSRDGGGVVVFDPVDAPFRVMVDDMFRVRTVTADWDFGLQKMIYTIEAVDMSIGLSTQFDFDVVDTDSSIAWRYNNAFALGEHWAQAAAWWLTIQTPVGIAERWHPANPANGITPISVNGVGQMTVAEALSRICSGEFTIRGGKYVPVVHASWANLPFDPYDDVTEDNPAGVSGVGPVYHGPEFYGPLHSPQSGVMYLAEWNPTTGITEPPYELYVNGSSKVDVREDAGAVLEDNVGALLLPASLVRVSPTWRRDTSRSVNQVTFKGRDTDDVEAAWILQADSAMYKYGAATRDIDTFATIRGGTFPLEDSPHSTFADDLYLNKIGDPTDWAPDTLEVLTHLMTDDQLTAYVDKFNPEAEQQQTLVLLDIQAEANPVEGPVWATLVGCSYDIRRDGGSARLFITPSVVPFTPDVTEGTAVTWAEIATAPWNTKTWNDVDPALTGRDLLLAHA